MEDEVGLLIPVPAALSMDATADRDAFRERLCDVAAGTLDLNSVFSTVSEDGLGKALEDVLCAFASSITIVDIMAAFEHAAYARSYDARRTLHAMTFAAIYSDCAAMFMFIIAPRPDQDRGQSLVHDAICHGWKQSWTSSFFLTAIRRLKNTKFGVVPLLILGEVLRSRDDALPSSSTFLTALRSVPATRVLAREVVSTHSAVAIQLLLRFAWEAKAPIEVQRHDLVMPLINAFGYLPSFRGGPELCRESTDVGEDGGDSDTAIWNAVLASDALQCHLRLMYTYDDLHSYCIRTHAVAWRRLPPCSRPSLLDGLLIGIKRHKESWPRSDFSEHNVLRSLVTNFGMDADAFIVAFIISMLHKFIQGRSSVDARRDHLHGGLYYPHNTGLLPTLLRHLIPNERILDAVLAVDQSVLTTEVTVMVPVAAAPAGPVVLLKPAVVCLGALLVESLCYPDNRRAERKFVGMTLPPNRSDDGRVDQIVDACDLQEEMLVLLLPVAVVQQLMRFRGLRRAWVTACVVAGEEANHLRLAYGN
jgi:hypothetical protein